MIDLKDLARVDSRGRQISVHGVRIGDPASALEELTFESLEPSFGGSMRQTAGQRFWLAEGSADEVELSESDVLDMMLHQGMNGRLRTREYMFAVGDGQVEQVFLFTSLLDPLGLDSAEAIEAAFGTAEGVERSFGTTFHYPARDLQIHFRPDMPEHRVTVVLGDDPWTPPVFDAGTLLQAYLDIAHLLPTSDGPMDFHGSKALEVRYERLQALLRTFGIPSHESMTHGTWLQAENTDHDKGLDALWEAARLERPDAPRLNAVFWAFRKLLRYRCGVELVLRHNKGLLEAGDGALMAVAVLTEATSKRLKAEVAVIDEVLCAFLDPEGRSFGLQDLVDHGYPDVDLRGIEVDEYY